MKKSMSVLGTMIVAASVISFASCASVQSVKPKFTGNEKIAVVSFAMNKSIVKKGDKPDNGPGLLKMFNKDYYADHEAGFAKTWTIFKEKAPGIFKNAKLIDFATIEGNKELLKLTKPSGKVKKIAEQYLYPEGLNFMLNDDPGLLKKVAEKTGADMLMFVILETSYDLAAGVEVAKLSAGAGTMEIKATIIVTDAEGKLVGSGGAIATSKETAAMLMGKMNTQDFPRLMESAAQALCETLVTEVAAW